MDKQSQRMIHKMNMAKKQYQRDKANTDKKSDAEDMKPQECYLCLHKIKPNERKRVIFYNTKEGEEKRVVLCFTCPMQHVHIIGFCPECGKAVEEGRKVMCVVKSDTLVHVRILCSAECVRSLENVYKLKAEQKGLEHKSMCLGCTKTYSGSLRCSVCKFATYCSKECQRADWKDHKVRCVPYSEK